MKRRSKLSIQVYRAITVTAIGLMIGAAPMRVMTVQAQETEKNQEQQSYDQKLDYKVFEDSSERLLEWSDIYMLSNEDIRIAKNEIYARHGYIFKDENLKNYFMGQNMQRCSLLKDGRSRWNRIWRCQV